MASAVSESVTFQPAIKDWLLAGALALLTLVSRIPFAGRYLFYSDSTRFGLAMEHFDVSEMRPHAPGYILYVAAAKLVDFLVHDAAASLVIVSILASAVTVAVLYFLAFRMYGRANAVLSSLLLASSPLFWFNGEMALTYALEGLLAVAFCYGCFRVLGGERKWLLPSAAFLGLATGVRQNMIVFLLPLGVYCLWKSPARKIVAFGLVFGLVSTAWFLPLTILSGGLKSYLQTLGAQFSTVVANPAPFFAEVMIRGKILASFLLFSFTLGIFPMLYFGGRFFRVPEVMKDSRLRFLLALIVPAGLFYLGITLWNPGQIIVILPPLFIFLAESIRGFSRDLEESFGAAAGGRGSGFRGSLGPIFGPGRPAAAFAGLTVAFNIGLFLFSGAPVSRAAIRGGDDRLSGLIRLTRDNFRPEDSLVLACQESTQAGYYLPDFPVYCPFPLIFSEADVPMAAQNVYISRGRRTSPDSYWLRTGFEVRPIVIPDGIGRLLVWEKDVAGYYEERGRPLEQTRLAGSEAVVYSLAVKPGEAIVYGYHRWRIS